VETLPVELLYHIFGYLDRESLLLASQVCGQWRTLIHELSWQHMNQHVAINESEKKLLEETGWSELTHSWSSCKCIDIHLGCYPYVETPQSQSLNKPETMTLKCEELSDKFQNFQPTCAINRNHVIVSRTQEETDQQQRTEILVFDRRDLKAEPQILATYHDTTEIHLYCYDNTLLVLERRAVENMITSIINVNNFRLNIWNTETLEHITEVTFLDKLDELPIENVHTEISDVAIAKDVLAVHVFVTNLDWLLPDEILQNPQSKNTTLFWDLNTSNPSINSLSFRTSIKKSLVEPHNNGTCDTGFIFLNESYFCRSLSGFHPPLHFSTQIQVFDVNDLKNCKPRIIDINQSTVKDYGDCNEDCINLEPGNSCRVSAYSQYKKNFKILNIKTGEQLMLIDFTDKGCYRTLFTTWQMYDANWTLGKFVFLQEVPNLETLKKSFQLIVVTDQKNRSGHLKNLPNLLIGNSLESDMEKHDMIVPGNRVHVDVRGLVLVTEQFLMISKLS